MVGIKIYNTVPSLIVHAENDRVVDCESSRKIISQLNCNHMTHKLLDIDHHVIVSNEGCDQVFNEVDQCISQFDSERDIAV